MSTLQELQARRALYVEAEAKILKSQEYVVGQGGNARRNRRADLETVQATIRELDDQIARAQSAGTRRVFNIVPGCR